MTITITILVFMFVIVVVMDDKDDTVIVTEGSDFRRKKFSNILLYWNRTNPRTYYTTLLYYTTQS